jgi:hypothetical protein
MNATPLLAIGTILLIAFASKKKTPATIEPSPVGSATKFVDGCAADANFPAELLAGQNQILQAPPAANNPAFVSFVRESAKAMLAHGYPFAAACLEKRARELETKPAQTFGTSGGVRGGRGIPPIRGRAMGAATGGTGAATGRQAAPPPGAKSLPIVDITKTPNATILRLSARR